MQRVFRSVLFATVISTTFLLQSCSSGTSSSASPVASVPLPEEGTIVVSSPNDDGFSTITGAANAAPASAIVIAEVSDYSAFNFDVPGLLKNLTQPAYATESSCTSDLPTCPDLSSDNECQFTANEDGSFVFQVPAEEGSEITLGYLDADNSCTETIYEESFTIDDDILSTDMDIVSAAFPSSSSDEWDIHLFGLNSEGVPAVVKLHRETQLLSDVDILGLPEITSTPTQILVDNLTTTDTQGLGFCTGNGVFFATYSPDGNYTPALEVHTETGESLNQPLIAGFDTYTLSTSEATSGTCSSVYPQGANTYARMFVLSQTIGDTDIYVLHSVDSTDSTSETRSYPIDTTNIGGYTIERYIAAVEKAPFLFALAQISEPTGNASLDYVALLKFHSTTAFCDSTAVEIVAIVQIENGEASSNYAMMMLNGPDNSTDSVDHIVVLDIDQQDLHIVNASDMSIDDFPNITTDTGMEQSILIAQGPSTNTADVFELIVLATDSGGTTFVMNYDGTLGTLELNGDGLSSSVVMLDPQGAYYDALWGNFYTFDAGLESDALSNILVQGTSN